MLDDWIFEEYYVTYDLCKEQNTPPTKINVQVSVKSTEKSDQSGFKVAAKTGYEWIAIPVASANGEIDAVAMR
jgi:hypothetical protein